MVLIKASQKSNPLYHWLDERIYKNNSNAVILISGDPGTGKTYSGMSICERYDSLFNQGFMRFDTKSLLKILIEVTENPEKYRGRIILYEEPQQEQSNKRSSSYQAVTMTTILSTFRSLNCILVITTPRESHLTKDLKDYIDVWLVTESIDRIKGLCYLTMKFASRNEVTKKVYWRFMRLIINETGELFVVKSLAVPKPKPDIVTYYEKKKLAYLKDLYGNLYKKIVKKEEDKEEERGKCPNCNTNFGYWNKEGWYCRKCGAVTVSR